MVVRIEDDFDLEKISDSGQCFRVGKLKGNLYRFICGDRVLYIREYQKGDFFVSCPMNVWEETWKVYFDLDRSYRAVFDQEYHKNAFTDRTMDFGKGLRVLRQDPWETLATFIISQRKNIPAISKAVGLLAENFGHKIQTEYETLYSFPSPFELADAGEEDFRECGLGYRAPYLLDAVSLITSGNLNLKALSDCDDQQLLRELQKIYGVGKKVANCVALFAYGRTACVPVDVWISRAIRQDCAGESPFDLFGKNAGIIQQYVFYYERNAESLSAEHSQDLQ